MFFSDERRTGRPVSDRKLYLSRSKRRWRPRTATPCRRHRHPAKTCCMETIITRPYASPCGPLLLGCMGERLCLCDWALPERIGRTRRRLLRQGVTGYADGTSPVLDEAARQLDAYFDGRRRCFDVPLHLLGTDFQLRVWKALLLIPYGATQTYGDLARRLGMGRGAQAVGAAVGANALAVFVPCHRVVGRGGALTGFAGGLGAKSRLLRLEAETAGRGGKEG